MKLTVTFSSQGRMLEAALFLPPQSTSELSPALLFEGTMTGATAMVTEHIAHDLSEEGFVCMVLDHAFYGDDESSAQSWESPYKRVEDIKAGLKILSEQATTDRESIVGVGVSVGAEYLARAIHESSVCKGFVMVQGPFDDAQNHVGNLDIPTLIVNENNLDAAVDEISIWVKTLLNRPGNMKPLNKSAPFDWSNYDK
ncbi:alpha/beta hydrolase family protein [Bdellovibrio svalbardensis]|uniref:Alpha/beta hydrolase n=1 Tax=Bdellovibrio svalbardensis TaxID=2972972 RepID=A0ABT6DGU2_9BACT|nr:alpha/beta hydrolase [Bdellovibrio svalbardensis]MDG0816070.1 alpha/beta hydrolase [Bdellovibrio svalbardensis]